VHKSGCRPGGNGMAGGGGKSVVKPKCARKNSSTSGERIKKPGGEGKGPVGSTNNQ